MNVGCRLALRYVPLEALNFGPSDSSNPLVPEERLNVSLDIALIGFER